MEHHLAVAPAAQKAAVAIVLAAIAAVALLWNCLALETPALRHLAHGGPHPGCVRCSRRRTRRNAERYASQAFEFTRQRRLILGAIRG